MAINDNRYIGSSQALRKQQKAGQQVGFSALSQLKELNASTDQYYKGVADNQRYVANLQSTLSASEAQALQQPSVFESIAGTAVQTATGIIQQQKKARAKRKQSELERQTQSALTNVEQGLNKLTLDYETSNWSQGTLNYDKQATELLAQLAPYTGDPNVQKYIRSKLGDINRVTSSRNKQVNTRLEQQSDKLLLSQADQAKQKLTYRVNPLLSKIKHGSLDEDINPVAKQVQGAITEFLSTSSLPEDLKIRVANDVYAQLNDSLSASLGSENKYSAQIKDTANGYASLSILDAEYRQKQAAAGGDEQKLLEAYNYRQKRLTELKIKYPAIKDHYFFKELGQSFDETQAQNMKLAETVKRLQSNGQSQAIQTIIPSSDEAFAMAASFLADTSGVLEMQLRQSLGADSPVIKNAIRLRTRMKSMFTDMDKVNTQKVKLRTDFRKMQARLSKLSLNFWKSLSEEQKKKELFDNLLSAQDKGQLGAEALLLLQQGSSMTKEQFNQYLQGITAGEQAIQKSKEEETEVRLFQIRSEYADLIDLGITDRNSIRQKAQQFRTTTQGYADRVNQVRQNTINQQQDVRSGVYGNFNQSSREASNLDGNLVRIIPRQRLATAKAYDGSTVITPFLATQSAPLSNNGHFGANRPGRPGGHAGQDYAVPLGAKAVALVPGKVVEVRPNARGYGGFVDVLGDNGFVYRYAHVRAHIKEGQRVNAGDVVAVINGSGWGSGPHLHFEVHPNPKYNNGKYVPSFGKSPTVDPLQHLKLLGVGNKTVRRPRANLNVYRKRPDISTPENTTLSNQGVGIRNGRAQQIGSKGTSKPASSVYNNQRQMRNPSISGWNPRSISNNPNQNLGYDVLRNDTKLRTTMHKVADRLGVPTEWIADIAAQESAGIQPQYNHQSPNQNYGLFGFGVDSFRDKSIHRNLIAGKIDGAGQVLLMEKYMTENGWFKLKKKRNGRVSIADFWAFMRGGVKWRERFHRTQNLNQSTEFGSYAREIKMLGRRVGREYNMDDRRSRLEPADQEFNPNCKICNQLAESGSWVPHVHDIDDGIA